LAFFLPIDVGKDDCGDRKESQNNGGEPDYGIFAHPLVPKSARIQPGGYTKRGWSGLKQLGCHVLSLTRGIMVLFTYTYKSINGIR
jgi:hypothetical protein